MLVKAGYSVAPPKMSPQYLKKLNFDVRTVFDIGVNKGTPGLYKAFRHATIVLVDPRQEAIDEALRRYRKRLPDIQFVADVCAAGRAEGVACLSRAGGRRKF